MQNYAFVWSSVMRNLCIDVTMLDVCIQGVKQYYFSFTSDMNLC